MIPCKITIQTTQADEKTWFIVVFCDTCQLGMSVQDLTYIDGGIGKVADAVNALLKGDGCLRVVPEMEGQPPAVGMRQIVGYLNPDAAG